MPYTALFTVLLALIWTLVVYSDLDNHHNAARVKIKEETVFRRYNITQTEVMWKLLKDPLSSDIYAGGPSGLYKLDQNGLNVDEVRSGSISLLTEGKDGSLFTCKRKKEKEHECCFLKTESDENCFILNHEVQINESSLIVDRTLFFTMSGEISAPANLGLYKQTFKKSYTWPQATTAAQKYIKIMTNHTTLNGKLYSFQTVKNLSQDPERPLWISQVSQYCMVDPGGSKSLLQFRWTSLLNARLFCGNKAKRMTFTELLDVAELETVNDTIIYALFKNAYNIRAVCVYQMSEISRIFSSSKFNYPKDPISVNPGECVLESRNSAFLRFMEQRPEMEESIMPEHDPFVFNHHLYSHIQVDQVNEKDVLFMTLESGKIHKVLLRTDDHFTIAEYLPFDKNTQIHSMLLDRSTKKLYVSNSSQVVQIDVQDCSHYGDSCTSCRLAKDPYCYHQCPPEAGASAEGVRSGDHSVCAGEGKPFVNRLSSSPRTADLIIPQHSEKNYLTCPTLSAHASYTWIHNNNNELECVSTGEECLLLIESMSKKDEGQYVCQAKEEGQSWTITSYHLMESGASHLRVDPAVMTCLLLLISVMIF